MWKNEGESILGVIWAAPQNRRKRVKVLAWGVRGQIGKHARGKIEHSRKDPNPDGDCLQVSVLVYDV